MQQLRILYQDDHLIAVDKPSGLQVHPPERRVLGEFGKTAGPHFTALSLLKKQSGKWIYPVHRLDRATSGVLLFALTSEAASKIQKQFQRREIKKTYIAVVRGWTNDHGQIDSPLKNAIDTLAPLEAVTEYETLYKFELPFSTPQHPTSRYSIVKAMPLTGRYHQIRRHFKHLSHPLIGDTVYGDGKHNRIFRELTGSTGLYLKAYSLEFLHPYTQEKITLKSKWGHFWHRLFELANLCPYL